MRASLAKVLIEAKQLPQEDLPALIGELAEVSAVAHARLLSPPVATPSDKLLGVAEAAARLHCSKQFLYRHHRTLPFTRRDKVGRKLSFSSQALDAYLRKVK